jgi:hypothetical protein
MSIYIVRTMARLSPALALLSLLGAALFVGTAARVFDPSSRSLNAKRLEAAKRLEYSARGRNGAGTSRRATDTSPPSRVKNITFTNPKASGASARAQGPRAPPSLSHGASRVLREWCDHTPSQLRCWPVMVGPDSYQQCGKRDKKGVVIGNLDRRRLRLTHSPVVLLVISSGSRRKSR